MPPPRIIARDRGIQVIILSMHSDESYILRALNAGARGYLLKDAAEGDFLPAVRSVATLLDEYLQTMKKHKVQDSYDLLTDREKEVLQLLAKAKRTKRWPRC